MSDNSPFPTVALEQLAAWHDTGVSIFRHENTIAAMHRDAAKTCRDAIAAHEALRERMMRAEHKARYDIDHDAINGDSKHVA